jgi:hypothetical protein
MYRGRLHPIHNHIKNTMSCPAIFPQCERVGAIAHVFTQEAEFNLQSEGL